MLVSVTYQVPTSCFFPPSTTLLHPIKSETLLSLKERSMKMGRTLNSPVRVLIETVQGSKLSNSFKSIFISK